MSSKIKGDFAPTQSKNPYELRLEILHLAQHIVDRENENKIALYHLLAEVEENLNLQFEKFNNVQLQKTEEEILTIARKLNDFVSNG